MKPALLIVEDAEDIRSQMKWALAGDYQVFLAEDRASAVKCFAEQRPLVVLLDLGLPPAIADNSEGLNTLAEILALEAATKVVIASGQADRPNALAAIGQGAYDFMCKPVEIAELKIILKRAFYVAQIEREFRTLQARQAASDESAIGLLGTSAPMQEVIAKVRKVAPSSAPVLILGESGTGKEMTSRAIHSLSPRKNAPLVTINCAAIPEALLESELFGHEKGAFTGAHAQRPGRIEAAHEGTLFLDEIGDLPLPLQAKLLRFLQESTIERVGGRKTITVDARVVAATNVDLGQATAEGKFREDLFYRLAVITIKMPALRERPNDIILLAKAFLKRFAEKEHKIGCHFSRPALVALGEYGWPGNVRELENRVKRAVIMADGKALTPADLELAPQENPGQVRTLREAREELDRRMLSHALARNNGKIAPAAAELGISRPTFYEIMERLGFEKQPSD